jgi:hypothetical protein
MLEASPEANVWMAALLRENVGQEVPALHKIRRIYLAALSTVFHY